MTHLLDYQWGPVKTPRTILKLIVVTATISLLCALTSNLFHFFLEIWGPQELLSLSWNGLSKYYLWQPLTFPFVQDGGSNGISIWYLISLAFNLYIIWILGSQLVDLFGKKSFLQLYFFSTFLAGLLTLLLMPLIGTYTLLAGPVPSILAIMVTWIMLNPENELLLFFLIPIKAKWLIVGIVAAILLIDLSNLDFIGLSYSLLGIFFGYLYGTMVWNLKTPFSITASLDQYLARKGKKWFKRRTSPETKDKVINIETGLPVQNDDQFVDQMLAKISRYGEKSLTYSQRKRLKEISEKKMKNRK